LFSVGIFEYCCIEGDANDDCLNNIKQIDFLKNIFIVDIVCGSYHCLSISNKGEIFSWGENGSGQIGNGKSCEDKTQSTPIKIFKI
jgi:alpha-tubulin suppressor-like RCC1 family protein